MKDIMTSASYLFDGGWRSSDLDELMKEFDLTYDEANEICKELAWLER